MGAEGYGVIYCTDGRGEGYLYCRRREHGLELDEPRCNRPHGEKEALFPTLALIGLVEDSQN